MRLAPRDYDLALAAHGAGRPTSACVLCNCFVARDEDVGGLPSAAAFGHLE